MKVLNPPVYLRNALLVAVVVALLLAACDGPRKEVGFQGYLTDASGTPITSNVSLVFRFFDDPANCAGGADPDPGAADFTETHNNVAVTNGLLNVDVGSVSTTGEGLDGVDPAVFAQPLWMEIVVDGEALEPCQKVLGAPYAMTLAGGAVVASDHEGDGAGGNDDTDENYGSLTVVNSAVGTSLVVAAGGGDLVRACSGNLSPDRACPNLRFRITNDGEVSADGSFSGGGADFAEMIRAEPASRAYEAGDVLVISPNTDRSVVLASEPYDTAVIGVYSTQPGFVGRPYEMEMADLFGTDLPVAIVGIVPVKVSAENGSIYRGDLLTTASLPGHAMKATDALPGTILGKAMGELLSGTGVIEVLLTLR